MLTGMLIYGLINSAVLVLMALGFSLTFGISGVSNFAYGAIYILAGYLAWIFLNKAGLPYPVAAVLAVLSCAGLGALLYRFVILRVRGLVLSEVMATFGIGLIILEMFRYLGFVGFNYTLPVFLNGSVAIGEAYIDYHRLAVLGVTVALGIGLYLFTHHTRLGLAFRGIAQNEGTALTLGIDSDRVATWSVAFGAALAALAAIVILPLGSIAPEGGYDVLVQALAVCIVGGLGSSLGIVLAGLLIGFAQTITSTYLESHWMILVSLMSILLVLVVKPSGLLGSQKELEERI
ncbi:MAG: branched-chain amino acid ABC transporter permease [Deltaproteobacteria bacterium]|nr:branched-chain amino acid ABC transporter permease [Deltaproteobacteria bacterium]